MEKEIDGRRVLIGMEHRVFQYPPNKPNIDIKISRPFNYLLMLGQDQAAVLHKELLEARELVEGTKVRIPGTLIYETKERNIAGKVPTRGYIMVQHHVQEDKSVLDIATHLADQGLHTLVDEYVHEPRNFVSYGGIVYWVDPTKGIFGRFLESRKLMKVETYRKIRRRLSRVYRFFGL